MENLKDLSGGKRIVYRNYLRKRKYIFDRKKSVCIKVYERKQAVAS